jgi:hypothetical protein
MAYTFITVGVANELGHYSAKDLDIQIGLLLAQYLQMEECSVAVWTKDFVSGTKAQRHAKI